MNNDYRIEWTEHAESMLDEIISYIAVDNSQNALKVLDRIQSQVKKLDTSPTIGRYVPELLEFGIRTYREIIIKPWRVIYRISNRTVLVMIVIDSRRNVGDYLIRELNRGKL